MVKLCVVCDKNAELACPVCNQVWYCTSAHVKEHAPSHASQCQPFQVNVSLEYGRHLVATKSLKAGELILREGPLVYAPGSMAEKVCFSCHKIFAKEFVCGQCQSPLCNKTCQMSTEHQKECVLLRRISAEAFGSAAARNEGLPVKRALFLLPLRCLLLRREAPQKWKQLIAMEAHVQARRQTPAWSFVQRRLAPHLKTMLHDQWGPADLENGELDTELIQRVCGILDINSFEIRIQPDVAHQDGLMSNPLLSTGEVLRGAYHQAALMAHSCVANAQISIGADHQMSVRALVPIRHGDVIYVSYTDPFQTTLQRRSFLSRGKHFVCKCIRCQDPEELGTFSSVVRCTSCPSGMVLPDSSAELMRWMCSACAKEMNHVEVARMEEVVQNIVKNIQRLPIDHHLIERCEELFVTLPKKLHPNHVMLMQLRIQLIHLYGNVPGFQMNQLPARLLQRKAQLCFELLQVLRLLCPGHSRLRGIVLYEFHAPLVVMASKNFENGYISAEKLIKELKNAEALLKEAVEILIYEPVDSPESLIAKAAMADLKQLREYVREMDLFSQSNYSDVH